MFFAVGLLLIPLVYCQTHQLEPGVRIRLESKNYPGHYMRHRNYQMWMDKWQHTNLFKLDSNFIVERGLAGRGTFSLRSVNYPDHYIRHSGFLCFIAKSDGSQLFKEDASWFILPGLALRGNVDAISFESYNYPGYYMRHQGYRVKISPPANTQLYKDDSTWVVRLTQ